MNWLNFGGNIRRRHSQGLVLKHQGKITTKKMVEGAEKRQGAQWREWKEQRRNKEDREKVVEMTHRQKRTNTGIIGISAVL